MSWNDHDDKAWQHRPAPAPVKPTPKPAPLNLEQRLIARASIALGSMDIELASLLIEAARAIP